MPRRMYSDRLFLCARAMMEYHAQRHSTVCAVYVRRWNVTYNFVQQCVLPNGHARTRRPTSSDRVCCPKAVMACHALRRSTVFPVQGR